MNCIRRICPNTVELDGGTHCVWKQGASVYKYPRSGSLDAFMHEVNAITTAPPQFHKTINMVEAVVLRPQDAPLDMIPASASPARTHPMIEMPLVKGTDAHTLLGQPDFAAQGQQVATAILAHARALARVNYANTDLKLENIIVDVDARTVTFIDWGSICKESAAIVPSRTFILIDVKTNDPVPLSPHLTMQLHVICTIAELGCLYIGEPRKSCGGGVKVTIQEVLMAHTFCQKWLAPDDLPAYNDFINTNGILGKSTNV